MAKRSALKKEDEGLRLRVKPGDQLSISIRVEALPQAAKPGKPAPAKKPGVFARAATATRAFFQRQKVSAFLKKAFSPMWLFILGCALFTLTRLIRLPDFPLYFSCDEANIALRGLDLVRDNGFDPNGLFLPPLFLNENEYRLGSTVYFQILPLLIFGKSVWVVRGTAALVSILGVIWFSLTLRDIFKLSLWWAGAFLFGVIPAWFLISRTNFETAQMTALYAGALYYYLRYRTGHQRSLYASVFLSALAFFAYLPGEITVGVTILALGLIDFKYHLQNRKIVLRAIGLMFLFALPMVNFVRIHPEHYSGALAHFNSYLTQPIPLIQKVETYLGNYVQGISPLYWFYPWISEDVHYVMKGYGHILPIFLPFAIWGIVRLVKRRSAPEFLAVFVPLLATPIAAATLKIEITRTLVEIIPIGILIMLGLEAGADWLEKHGLKHAWVSAGVVILFSAGQVYMLNDALTRGPTWWSDYGISGIQYGSNQVFKEAMAYSQEHPDTQVKISGGWIFQASVLGRFFIPPGDPIDLATPDQMPERIAKGEDLTFVVTPEEYKRLVDSGDYKAIQVEKVIPCPDGSPCFRFIRLEFTPEKMAAMQIELIEKTKPETTQVEWNNETLEVTHTQLSAGPIDNLFDGNNDSFIRSDGVNPLKMAYTFPKETELEGVKVRVGSEPITVTVIVNGGDSQKKQVYTQKVERSNGNKEMVVEFGGVQKVSMLEVAVENMDSGADGFVHIWEMDFLQTK